MSCRKMGWINMETSPISSSESSLATSNHLKVLDDLEKEKLSSHGALLWAKGLREQARFHQSLIEFYNDASPLRTNDQGRKGSLVQQLRVIGLPFVCGASSQKDHHERRGDRTNVRGRHRFSFKAHSRSHATGRTKRTGLMAGYPWITTNPGSGTASPWKPSLISGPP